MATFIKQVNNDYRLQIENYFQLYKWSIEKAEAFWETFWKFSGIIHHSPYDEIVDDISKMPGALWFKGSTLNFAENLLRYKDDHIAIRFFGEDGTNSFLSYDDLYKQVAGLASALKKQGIKKGDRVCGFLPNIP
ncbi:uncharacterized protein METZ01_LOCUS480316, partial [marine metagenome]